MIVIPINFIIALALGGIGVILLIITSIVDAIYKAIKRKKKHENNR